MSQYSTSIAVNYYLRRTFVLFILLAAPVFAVHAQTASGVLPEASVLQISEEEGQAQMAVRNGENTPLLMHTRIYDLDGGEGLVVVPLPPMVRVEAKSRQIVRFVLERPPEPLKVQHYKRVTFEGIPPRSGKKGDSQVQVNVRYDLPVLISPRGLAPLDDPWSRLVWTLEGRRLTVHNPSPYVVRMSREVELLPAARHVELLQRTVVLPGDTVGIDLPDGVGADALTAVRLFPVTLYGFAAPDFDAPIKR